MKILTLCTLVLAFCGIVILSVAPHEGHSHAQGADASPWAEHLVTFYEILDTDTNAARAELQNVAKNLFNEHVLADEWLPLFFRISHDGTKEISDVKRLHELEIRMLTAIDAEKYTKQIQQHQEALKDLTELDDVFDDESLKEPIATEQQITSQTSSQALDIAYKTFFQLLLDTPESARAVLDIYALIAFDNHSLTKEWKEIFFQLCQDKEGTLLEVTRLFELRKQMLTDNDPKKHAEEIKQLASNLKKMKLSQRLMERYGETDKKFPFNAAPK